MLSLFNNTQQLGTPGPLNDFWFGPIRLATVAGQNVTDEVAMTYSAVWAATRLLAGSGASLPFNLLRRLGPRRTEIADAQRVHWLIHDQPNPEMTSFGWRSLGINKQVNRGNFYNEIERDSSGNPLWLWPIDNDLVTPGRATSELAQRFQVPENSVVFKVRNNDPNRPDFIPDRDMFHVRSIVTGDGVLGKGVIENARETIGMGIATERQGAAYMKNSARPKVVIKGGKFRGEQERQEYRRTWMNTHGGAENNALPAMLPMGADISTLDFTPEDSQFLQTRQHNVEEVARWYGIPPHLIAHLLRSTFSNITQQSIEFVVYSLMPWLVLWEQEVKRKLLVRSQRRMPLQIPVSRVLFAKHNVEGLLRGDPASRAAFYDSLWQKGVFSANDILDLEDRNSIGPAGDKRFVPVNMMTLEQAGERPQQEDSLSVDELIEQLRTEHNEQVAALGELHRSEMQEALERQSQQSVATIGAMDQRAQAIQNALHKQRNGHGPDLKALRTEAERHLREDVIANLLEKEANAALSAAQKPHREFFQWIDEFYDNRLNLLRRVLCGPVRVCLAVDGRLRETPEVVEALSQQWIEQSREDLLYACECQPDEVAERVAAMVDKWPQRADEVELDAGA